MPGPSRHPMQTSVLTPIPKFLPAHSSEFSDLSGFQFCSCCLSFQDHHAPLELPAL